MLQYHFHWATLSVIAGITWWNFYFQLVRGSVRSPQVVGFLTHLLRHLPGNVLVVWDRLAQHRSRLVRDFIAAQGGCLAVEWLPAYAPELNPAEYIWGYLKDHKIPNLCPKPAPHVNFTFSRPNGKYTCMKRRPLWTSRITIAWRRRPIVWLAGVRRAGKTTLARMLPSTVYLNCDLPSVVRRLDDPELFFRSIPRGGTVVLDEVHRLPDPSRTLKIAADAFPSLRILATGSSTLAATRKFRDTLTGRKAVVVLPPVLWPEVEDGFASPDLDHRLLRGGLPEMLLAADPDPDWYAEWLDSFYARDIQELFGIRERTGFLNLLRLMLRQSGGLADYSALSRECDLSRPTVKAHLEAMASTLALVPVAPFHGGGRRELVKRPKVYGFDTGFVAFVRGWTSLRDEDRGPLWEHLVLDVLRTGGAGRSIAYWRDKSDREIDFVIPRGRQVDAIECKVQPDRLDPGCLTAFRERYPRGRNIVVSPGTVEAYDRRVGSIVVRVMGCRDLTKL